MLISTRDPLLTSCRGRDSRGMSPSGHPSDNKERVHTKSIMQSHNKTTTHTRSNHTRRCFRACLHALDELNWLERGRTSEQARITYSLGIQVRFCFNQSLCAWSMANDGGQDERSDALKNASSSHTHSSDPVTSVRRPAIAMALTSPFVGF